MLKIQIKWSENLFLHKLSIEHKGERARVFNSFFDFDCAMRRAAVTAPATGGYDKTTFIVEAVIDGVTDEYIGRFDLHHISQPQETSTRKISLKQHMIDHCKYVCENKKDTMPEVYLFGAKQWLDFLVNEQSE